MAGNGHALGQAGKGGAGHSSGGVALGPVHRLVRVAAGDGVGALGAAPLAGCLGHVEQRADGDRLAPQRVRLQAPPAGACVLLADVFVPVGAPLVKEGEGPLVIVPRGKLVHERGGALYPLDHGHVGADVLQRGPPVRCSRQTTVIYRYFL